MISMNNQPGFIPVISMFPPPIYPQFIPTILAPMIPYNLLPPMQNNNYPPVVTPESQENYEMPPGLTDQNVAYSSYGQYYGLSQNNNGSELVGGFNLPKTPYNFGETDSQDPEFAEILNSVYKSVWDDVKPEMSIYQSEYMQPEVWKRLLLEKQQGKENNMIGETELLEQLFGNKREESGDYCCERDDEEDQINGTLLKFNDFQVIKQRLRLMDSYKVELKEGIFVWEEVNTGNNNDDSNSNKDEEETAAFDFGVMPLSVQANNPLDKAEIAPEDENRNGDYVSPLRELLVEENNKESPGNCLQDLMGKDLNDQKGVDILETLLQLQKKNLGPFLIDYQIQENTGNDYCVPTKTLEKKSKKKRKNKNKRNTKNNTQVTIENPEQPVLSHNSTIKSIDDLESHNQKPTTATTSSNLDNNNEESEVQKAKRILAELEDAINNLDNPKPNKRDDLKSERIETIHSASTDFGEQSSMESGKTDQKLSRAQKKKMSKKKKQHLQSINDYIESTSAIHKIDSNYIAMLSSVLAEDPFALVKLKEVVLAQNMNELGFTEEEIQEIEEVNLELEKTMKRTMDLKNESDYSEPDSNSYRGVDSPDRMKYDELPEPKTRNMPLPEFLGEDFYKFHNDELDILDEPVNISEADLTAISYLEELMKNRANFLADFGVSGFGPFEDEK